MKAKKKQLYSTDKQFVLSDYQMDYRTNYKWKYFLEMLRSNRELRQFLAATSLVALGFLSLIAVISYSLIIGIFKVVS